MPTRTNRRTGEVQELQPDGNWKTIAPPSATAPAFSTQTKPANPAQPYIAPKAAAETSSAQSDAALKAAQAANALALAQAQRDKAVADAQAAQAQAQMAQQGGNKLDPSARAAAIQSFNMAKQLGDVAAHLRQLYLQGPGATSGLEGMKDFLPTPENKNFDTEANKSRGIVGMTLGFTGGQLNTPQEAEKGVGPYIPQSANFDSTILQKIQSMQDLSNNGKAKAIQILGGEPDINGNIQPINPNRITPSNALPPITGNSQDSVDFATGKTRDVIDPVLKATGGRIGRMIASGVPDAKIIDFLKKSGVDPSATNVQPLLEYRAGKRSFPGVPSFKEWQRANPGKSYPIGPQFYTKQVPMTADRQLLNKAAASDIGGAGMAAGAGLTNAITGGYLNDLTPDPAAAQTGMDLLRGRHPLASFGGDVAGQIALEGMAGGLPGVGRLLATTKGRRVADALYGAYSGSGENDDNRGVGAVGGGVLGLGMGALGRGAQRALGNAATGITDPSLQYLNNAGVPLTVGRIARGVGNIDPHGPTNIADEIGKGAGGIEERLMSLPGMDAIIGTARQRGDAAFNNEAFRQIAPGVLGRGTEGLASAKAAETAAYSKLNGARFAVDPQFEATLSGISDAAKGLARHSGDVADVINDVRSQIAGGEMSGEGFQSALQSIRRAKASLSNDVMGHKAADILGSLDNEMTALGARQGGSVAQDLAEANAIHARRQIIKTASKSSAAQAGEMFSPTQLNQAAISNTTKFGGSDLALSSGRPFFDLTRAGMDVMPSLTPDSGTAGRLQLFRALGSVGVGLGGGVGALTGDNSPSRATEGGGMGLAGGIALGTLLSAPYSHTGQKVIQRALLSQRPRVIQKIGEYLINADPKLAGMLASAIGRDYAYQPELSQ